MGVIIKTEEEIKDLRVAGSRLAQVLDKVKQKVKPGVSAKELDQYAYDLIKDLGDEPAFLNYTPHGVSRPYPSSLCVSINEEVVHGIPKESTIIKDGDIVSIDLGLKYRNVYADHAVTVLAGSVDPKIKQLVKVTREALDVGINAANGGNRVGDIGHAIEEFVKPYGYGIVDILAGHGVGREIHEDPYIPNFGIPGTGEKLKPGMVIAIEPMLNLGSKYVVLEDDEYTFTTRDKKPSAHFEHTVLITSGKAEVLTKV